MKRRSRIGFLVTSAALVLAVASGRAQQPARTPTAPPPINWPSPPLPDGPIVLDTGIQHQIRLIVTKGLVQPWSMAFLPDGAILITERPGRLRIVRDGVLDPNPIAGVPKVQAQGLGGLMDLALHPRFSENKLIYFTYHKPAAESTAKDPGIITLARGRWDGTGLADVSDLFSTAIQGSFASRIVFGKDGMVYMTVGIGDPPGAARAHMHWCYQEDPVAVLRRQSVMGGGGAVADLIRTTTPLSRRNTGSCSCPKLRWLKNSRRRQRPNQEPKGS